MEFKIISCPNGFIVEVKGEVELIGLSTGVERRIPFVFIKLKEAFEFIEKELEEAVKK